jgi:hypothetical protein
VADHPVLAGGAMGVEQRSNAATQNHGRPSSERCR